ncbi:MAG TPA: enoyl-CoA hydratase/isomerase family protein [Novosphingobium sp.]|nr:enoyl-CoA hydratase/isomerase family protein [Novosphingobium sp.]
MPTRLALAYRGTNALKGQGMTITLHTETRGNIGHIRFGKPPFNYACPELLRQIADAIDAFDASVDVRCIVLSSEGKPFCGGADLVGDEAIAGEAGMDAVAGLYGQAMRIFRRRKPMVAAVQGAAVGAGLGLALAADFRVAAPAARFSANFVRLAFHPGFAISHVLPRVIGEQKAAWMLLSAARIKAEEALAWGLADRLTGQAELLDGAFDFAAQIAANAPLALEAVRATMMADTLAKIEAVLAHEHAQQSILKQTADYAEGVASVFERRDAKFVGG